MTADQRLDQLEPLMSESMAILDRHTAQLKQLIVISTQHSESISFLIHEVLEVKTDVAALKTDVAVLKTDVAALTNEVVALKTGLAGVDAKLDRILEFLEASGK